ncbi:MAG: DUF167 domain-containing protein [Chloroflexi bacterium]|nr:DUF167 domain-containing protein [Chloroflexota bacterium]
MPTHPEPSGPSRFTVRFTVRLTPRASREGVTGERDGVWQVRVTAPPVDGAANEALLRLLAKRLRAPRSTLRIAIGDTARTKVIEVEGLDVADARERLGEV